MPEARWRLAELLDEGVYRIERSNGRALHGTGGNTASIAIAIEKGNLLAIDSGH
jgi:hypothetical protein